MNGRELSSVRLSSTAGIFPAPSPFCQHAKTGNKRESFAYVSIESIGLSGTKLS